jgi:sec-independent protein translocase protein TatA
MAGLTPMHLLLILGIAVLILGPKRLPEAGEALGRALREFREAVGTEETKTAAPVTAPAAPVASAAVVAPVAPAVDQPVVAAAIADPARADVPPAQ